MRLTNSSLPGMGVAETIDRVAGHHADRAVILAGPCAPGPRWARPGCRCRPARPARRGSWSIWSIGSSTSSGHVQVAQLARDAHVAAPCCAPPRPPGAREPAAVSITCCTREMFEAKVATITRPLACGKDAREGLPDAPAPKGCSPASRRWCCRRAAAARRARPARPAWRNRCAGHPPGCGRT